MRRANGTGTIVKLSGNRRRPYVVRVPNRNKYGKVVQIPLSYHEKASEAQAALDAYNAAKANGMSPASATLDRTVQDVYNGWSAREYKKLGEKGRSSSLNSHKAAWNKRISRYAARRMRSVSLDEWQSIIDEDEDNGLSQSLVNNDAILIRSLYAYAMERDIVSKDLSMYLDIPAIDPKNPKGAFTDIQLAALERMAAEGFPWADTALMLCYTGYRISEFLTLSPFSYRPQSGGYLVGGTKTDAGKNRIVPVHPKIKPYLLKRLDMGRATIVAKEDGQPITSHWYREHAFQPIATALGSPEATPHWCRHTFSTRLYAAGVDEFTRKVLLGHSTRADVTAGYTHPDADSLAKEPRKMA